ncbi:DUF2634 domain-containing protein [Propionispora vibrioides]|uniref:DUF2634 domain-containing protein n=1 Tax=Propionispora vibrioides TaxID=112903 RepID=A0A1H8U6F1_9FIRM|nr:DUF2634 domain-containing protein [Propionispora vibrioides]SEO98715.1 Protein of unknown function [Propionispora vibrioides]
MANLFPATALPDPQTQETTTQEIVFGRNVELDYTQEEFVLSPTGRQYKLDETNSWVEWCVKALATPRYKHLIYSDNYGSEFETLIGKSYSHEAAESEIRRMAKECLLADSRTANVDNFQFEWIEDGVIFVCRIVNVRGESRNIGGKVVL